MPVSKSVAFTCSTLVPAERRWSKRDGGEWYQWLKFGQYCLGCFFFFIGQRVFIASILLRIICALRPGCPSNFYHHEQRECGPSIFFLLFIPFELKMECVDSVVLLIYAVSAKWNRFDHFASTNSKQWLFFSTWTHDRVRELVSMARGQFAVWARNCAFSCSENPVMAGCGCARRFTRWHVFERGETGSCYSPIGVFSAIDAM